MKQQRLFQQDGTSFGGDLMKKRKGRGARPLDTRHSMHLVLRSTQATGAKSFLRHRGLIHSILQKFADKFGIHVYEFANVGNHLHIHMKLGTRQTWRPFIRAVTAAIAVKIGRKSRWNKSSKRFWDRRPFTRVAVGRRAFKTLSEYVRVNLLEGFGVSRALARRLWREGYVEENLSRPSPNSA